MKNNKKIQYKRINLELILISLVFIGIVIFFISFFIPSLYVKDYLNSQFENILEEKTILQKNSFKNDYINPTYVVFTLDENKKVTAHFVWLRRKNVFGWEMLETSYEEIEIEAYLSEEEKKKLVKENIDSLYQAVKKGDLKEGSKFLAGELADSQNQKQEQNYVLKEIKSLIGDHTAVLKIGINPDENQVYLDNKKVAGLKNVTEIQFDSAGKNLYYSKYYLKKNGNEGVNKLISSGKIFKYNLLNQEETMVYDFKKEGYISFKFNEKILSTGNQKGIYYALNSFDNVEIGNLNLNNQEIIEKNLPKDFRLKEFGGEEGLVFIEVISADNTGAWYKILENQEMFFVE